MTSSSTNFVTTIYCVVILLWNITQIHGLCRSSLQTGNNKCLYEIPNKILTRDDAAQYCRDAGGSLMPANNNSGHLENFNFWIYDKGTGNELCGRTWTSLSYNAATDVVDFANGDTLPTSSWDTVSTSDASAECLVAERGTGSVPALLASDCNEKLNFVCIRLESPCQNTSCGSNQRCVPQYSTSCSFVCEDNPSTTINVLPSTDSSTDTTSNGTNSPTTEIIDIVPTTTEESPTPTPGIVPTTTEEPPTPSPDIVPTATEEPPAPTSDIVPKTTEEPPGLEWWKILLIAIGCVGAVCLGVYVVHKHCRTTPAQSVSAKFKNVV